MGAAFSTGRMAVCWKKKTGGVDRRVLAVLFYEGLGGAVDVEIGDHPCH